MAQRWGPDFHKKMLISGGSAGSVFAITIAMGKSVSFMDEFYSTVAVQTLKYNPIYFGSYFLEQVCHIKPII
jgi:patatin-like phospholipase/acyl hydrolase